MAQQKQKRKHGLLSAMNKKKTRTINRTYATKAYREFVFFSLFRTSAKFYKRNRTTESGKKKFHRLVQNLLCPTEFPCLFRERRADVIHNDDKKKWKRGSQLFFFYNHTFTPYNVVGKRHTGRNNSLAGKRKLERRQVGKLLP